MHIVKLLLGWGILLLINLSSPEIIIFSLKFHKFCAFSQMTLKICQKSAIWIEKVQRLDPVWMVERESPVCWNGDCAAELVYFEPRSVASRPREKEQKSFLEKWPDKHRYQVKWLKCVENMVEAAAAAPSNVVKLGLPVVWQQGVSLGTTPAYQLVNLHFSLK